ncbi:hypothetical protein K710_1822 [Streptococcus iniae SF1]|nr:hypothetical protein K710_1822 [Streptococcus iniae SF1]
MITAFFSYLFIRQVENVIGKYFFLTKANAYIIMKL